MSQTAIDTRSHAELSHYELRTDLAAALRWAARLNLNEGVDNHFSIAVPDASGNVNGDLFLINPFGWHWSEVTASSMVLCDAEGNVLEGDNTVEDTAFYIHSRIHVNVPSATVVLHTHQPYVTALSLLTDCELKMCEQNALSFHNRIAYDNAYNGLALGSDEGNRLAGMMDGKSILMMAGHGVTVTGPTMKEAFNDLYYLERAAMFQVLAMSTGKTLLDIPEDVIAKTAAQQQSESKLVADRHFKAIKRMLAQQEPEYLQ
jgi:ribulose-5-phosphate 4-epimerase/fuculose-1-phosphate aldolase